MVFTDAGEDHQGGIYLWRHDGSLTSIIQNGDVLDEMTLMVNQTTPANSQWWVEIPPLSLNVEGFNGKEVAFLVGFSDNTSGIYLAKLNLNP